MLKVGVIVAALSILAYACSAARAAPPIEFYGFLDARTGARVSDDVGDKDLSLGEVRLQLKTEQYIEQLTLNLAIDFLLDPVADRYRPDLASGEGAVDPRQINIEFSPADFADVKVGRQVITWGTGDLVFINDLFAKDWNSFFIGRDVEYLKAPVDAIKGSFFFDFVNLDLVYTPKFGADRFVDGRRASFFDRQLSGFRGRNDPLSFDRPDEWFADDEFAARAYRSFGAFEAALYAYHGFWKSPAGLESTSEHATFPKLNVFGGSARGPVFGGVVWVEAGYYDSKGGAATDPLIRNSELRFLAGFEKELATEFTASVQYNLERKLDYDDYVQFLSPDAIRDDKNRHIVTLRLTKLLFRQDMELSLFNFYSPSDEDGYVRFTASYKITDNLKIEGGGNFFYGGKNHTFFSQFKNNNNLYVGVRRSF